MIWAYSTFAGARRRRREVGGAIIRILNDPDEMFVVVSSFLLTTIMSVADDGSCDGSISLMALTAKGADHA